MDRSAWAFGSPTRKTMLQSKNAAIRVIILKTSMRDWFSGFQKIFTKTRGENLKRLKSLSNQNAQPALRSKKSPSPARALTERVVSKADFTVTLLTEENAAPMPTFTLKFCQSHW